MNSLLIYEYFQINYELQCLVSFVLGGGIKRIKIRHVLLSWFHIHDGVPQGTKLGPLLFIVMINDLSVQCDGFKYVHDTSLKHTHYDYKSSNVLQEATNDAFTWSVENHMRLNPKKTKEMTITFWQNTDNIAPVTLMIYHLNLLHARNC